LYESHKVQWITRAWSSFSSARIRRAPQFPHVYSSLGLVASSNGGAWTTAPRTSGSGMTLSLFCGRSDIVSSSRNDLGRPGKKEPRAICRERGAVKGGNRHGSSTNQFNFPMRRLYICAFNRAPILPRDAPHICFACASLSSVGNKPLIFSGQFIEWGCALLDYQRVAVSDLFC
jgi:hypothetical protein